MLASPLLSVIIPVYNIEPAFLLRCADSLGRQDYDNIEVVFVDDGSSYDYRDVWSQISKDNSYQLKVIEQKNQGVSAARNRGAEAAAGDLVMFVDPDDEVSEGDCIKNAIDIMVRTGADAVFGRVSYRFAHGDYDYPFGVGEGKFRIVDSPDEIKEFSCFFFSYGVQQGSAVPSHLNRAPHAKIFRRKLLDKAKFDEKLSYAEDSIFNSEIVSHCQSVALVDSIWYIYYQYERSLSHADKLATCRQHNLRAREHVGEKELEDAYLSYARHCILEACVNRVHLEGHRSYEAVSGFASQDWVQKTIERSDASCFRISDWEARLVNCIGRGRYRTLIGMVMLGQIYMKLRRKKLIDPGRDAESFLKRYRENRS